VKIKQLFFKIIPFTICVVVIYYTLLSASLFYGLKKIPFNESAANIPIIKAYIGMEIPYRYTTNPIYWLPLHLLPAKEYHELETPIRLTALYWIAISVVISKLLFILVGKIRSN